ncbi:MAG: TIGR02391 family protein [Deltaproteobacteria bacterium]|nr:TIGR02391 family protein [Deltaproteobacteria bacterium]
MKSEDKIEYQEIIDEAKAGSYQPIRFSRIKYKNNPETLIDIRIFQRGYDEEGNDVYYPTKKGFQFLESEFKKVVKSWTILPSSYVHPDVIDKSFELLAKRQFESAVLQAFKFLEIRIREKAGLSKDEIGIKLIRKAFYPNKGILSNMALPVAEREAMANYIAGAYGLYKNPCSHRAVEMEFLEAFERIVIASNILKMIEAAQLNETKE